MVRTSLLCIVLYSFVRNYNPVIFTASLASMLLSSMAIVAGMQVLPTNVNGAWLRMTLIVFSLKFLLVTALGLLVMNNLNPRYAPAGCLFYYSPVILFCKSNITFSGHLIL